MTSDVLNDWLSTTWVAQYWYKHVQTCTYTHTKWKFPLSPCYHVMLPWWKRAQTQQGLCSEGEVGRSETDCSTVTLPALVPTAFLPTDTDTPTGRRAVLRGAPSSWKQEQTPGPFAYISFSPFLFIWKMWIYFKVVRKSSGLKVRIKILQLACLLYFGWQTLFSRATCLAQGHTW